MHHIYVASILAAIALSPAFFFGLWNGAARWMRRRAARGIPFAALLLTACNIGDASEATITGSAGDAGTGGGATTTTTKTDPCVVLNCQAPQVCGGGCATDGTVGCYTPGGNLDAGPWDCPSCFAAFDHDDAACGTAEGRPYAYFCQDGSQALQGCVWSSTASWYQCCPPGVDGGRP